MIQRIRIRNFKSLFDVEVDLGPFTVLIGQNGAGKSSFLQAIQVLSWLVRYRSINDALAANDLSYNELVYLRASSSAMHWDLDLAILEPPDIADSIGARVMISLAKRKYVYVTQELVCPSGAPAQEPIGEARFAVGRVQREMFAKEGSHRFGYENVTLPHSVLLDASLKRDQFPILGAVADELGGFLHSEIWGPEPLRRSSEGSAAGLTERGENLPSVLHTLRSRAPERFAALVGELRTAYSWLDSVEIRRLGENRFGLSFLERASDRRRRRVRYAPSQVSDGFLRLLALTTLKYQTRKISILGYEEPENGMHPGMLTESVRRLRDLAAAGTQVIVTTHSPFLLQHLLSADNGGDPAEELRLVWRGGDGRTVIRPPDADTLQRAREQGIGVGELWAMLLAESDMAKPALPEQEEA